MRNRFFASLFVVIALVFGATNSASADQWDYIYGEDPTNANNVSVFTEVRIDPRGGIYLFGYFYGQYEGLSSPSQFLRFAQHRSAAGNVDWTIPLPNNPQLLGGGPPQMPYDIIVDGQGVAFISETRIAQTGWFSIDRQGVVTLESGRQAELIPGTSTFSGDRDSLCTYRGTALKQGGLVRLCPNKTIELVNSTFQQVWSYDVSAYISSVYHEDVNTRVIAGSNDSIWFLSNLNVNNVNQEQVQLPDSLRSAMSMLQLDGATGVRLNAVKHLGMIFGKPGPGPMPFAAQSIGDRTLWIETLAAPASQPERTILKSFSAIDGRDLGTIDTKWANSTMDTPGFLPNGFCNQLIAGYGLKLVEAQSIECIPGSLLLPGWGSLGVDNYSPTIGGWQRCSDNEMAIDSCPVIRLVRNDGRRLIMAVGPVLLVMELTGDDIPSINRVISTQRFTGTIRSLDADDLGNIYVVGSTFETRIVQTTELRQSASNIQPQTLSANRAFISRNPMGRISLDVLPRTPLRIKVAGTNGVPATGVGAVSMNVTVTSPDGEGFITVYPCDSKPDASNLNYTLDQTVPNAVIAPVSSTGEVCFYTNAQTHLLADINGYFPTGQGFTAAGPARIFDTRAGSAQGLRTVIKEKIGGNKELRIQMTDIAGLTPGSGIGAVSLNVTATATTADEYGGYVTVYPCGSLPNASNLNFASGQTVPNAVIAPVSASGEVCFYARGTTDLIVDLNGYFLSGSGFTPTAPTRIADTRAGSAQGTRTVTKTKIGGDTTLKVKFTDIAGLTPSTGVGAVSLNVTATGTTADEFGGYVTVYPCGTIPNASNLNFVSKQTVPNAVITPVSASGEVCFYARGTTDLIIDLNGYFPTGAGFTPMSPVRLFDTR
jgi:hypothetical protein